MSVFSEILTIEVALRGVERVQQGLDKIIERLGASEAAVKKLENGLKLLGVAIGLTIGGLREQMESQHFQAMYEGLTGSAEQAARQMVLVDRIASKGLFKEIDVLTAIETMNKFGISVEKNISLVEKLGARSGNLESAANLISMIESGSTSGLTRRLRQFGIGPDKLRAAGLQVDGMEVKGSSQDILNALEKIEATDKTITKLQGTMGAQLQRLIYQFGELVETIGAPLISPLTEVLRVVTEIFRWVKDLNAAMNGWVSNFLVGGLLITGLVKIVGFLKEISALEKLIALWAGIRSVFQAGPVLLAGLANVIRFLFSMRAIEAILVVIETARAFLAAAMAAAMGNIPGALAAVALIVAAGVGAAAAARAVNGYRNSQSQNSGDSSDPAAQRPVRRDDVERVYKKMYGKAWTG
jgi:hypothetical protein